MLAKFGPDVLRRIVRKGRVSSFVDNTSCVKLSKFSGILINDRVIFRYNHNGSHQQCVSIPETEIVYKKPWAWKQPKGHDTGITLKNSYQCTTGKTKAKVPFIVGDPNHVTWYACGPTVYDSSHIGHASTYLQFDLIRRILTKYFGLNICMVMGITNMDNKIINRAALYDLDIMEMSNSYQNEFQTDMNSLNVLPPTTYIRVTDIIPQIIEFIQGIIDKKQAYVSDKGNVYFSYNSAHQSIAKLRGEFFEPDETVKDKRFVKDIILWKRPNHGEPYWDAPWGKGRPGWHIECSVMASMCFGDSVDIHSGADDLIYPHHEYEVAQCDAFHGCHQWVNYFLHTGHVQFGGDKMSKSLGNTILIEDFLKKFEEPDVLRMISFDVDWDKGFVFTDKFAKKANINIELFSYTLKKCLKIISGQYPTNVDNDTISKAITDCENEIRQNFMTNFDTRRALVNLKKFCVAIQRSTKMSTTNDFDVSAVIKAMNSLNNHLSNLGFTFHKRL